MKPGTVIQLPDGRVGTICWCYLDGEGGVWGRHDFSGIPPTFDEAWPAPEFMLREKAVEPLLRRGPHRSDIECVGGDYEVIDLCPGLNATHADGALKCEECTLEAPDA